MPRRDPSGLGDRGHGRAGARDRGGAAGGMITPPSDVRIVLIAEPVDFRNYAESKVMRNPNENRLESCSLSAH